MTSPGTTFQKSNHGQKCDHGAITASRAPSQPPSRRAPFLAPCLLHSLAGERGSGMTFLVFLITLAVVVSVGILTYLERDRIVRYLSQLQAKTVAIAPPREEPRQRQSLQTTPVPEAQTRRFTIFVSDSSGEQLQRVEAALDEADGRPMLDKVLERLFRPAPGANAQTVPEGTEVLAYYMSADGTLYLDVNAAFLKQPQGSWSEAQAVYAIVNTVMMAFPAVQRVRFLVEGKPVATLAGHLDLSRPLTARTLAPLIFDAPAPKTPPETSLETGEGATSPGTPETLTPDDARPNDAARGRIPTPGNDLHPSQTPTREGTPSDSQTPKPTEETAR